MTDQYLCQSFYDESGTLQNCTCGKCGEGVDEILLSINGAVVDTDRAGYKTVHASVIEAKTELFNLIASKAKRLGHPTYCPHCDGEMSTLAVPLEKLKKLFGIDTGEKL